MIHPPARTLAAALAAGVLLTGCSTSDPTAGTGSTGNPSSSAPASPSASASPTSTLTAEEQQAFAEATEVVLAYRQTITDLYSGARTNLNDLNDVAAGELRDQGLQNIQQSLSDGWRREPQGVELVLVSASPLDFELAGNPYTVVVRACIDATDVTIVDPTGTKSSGIREELDYTLTRTSYLPDPGWVVTRVTTGNDDPKARQC
jgi:hypothetical protein